MRNKQKVIFLQFAVEHMVAIGFGGLELCCYELFFVEIEGVFSFQIKEA